MTGERKISRKATQLYNARLRYPIDDLTAALADLEYRFGTFTEWPPPDRLMDDREFEQANPDHPYVARNRFRRQEAARFFYELAEGDPSLVTDEALDALHRSLFDCSAAVRYDLAMALGHLNRPESAPFLQQLIATDTEPGSVNVREAAQWAYSGRISNTYGSPITSSSLPATFRRPGESDITRDDNRPNMDGSDVFFLLWAACAWEHRARLETDVIRKNFTELSRPDFTFKVDGSAPQHLSTSRLRAYRTDLERRIEAYQFGPVTVAEVHSRFQSVLHLFRLFGYYDNYAGHEGQIRIRLLGMLRQAGFRDPEATTAVDSEVRRFAAYYLAFTDYCLRGVPRALDEVPPADIRAFLSHSSADKECARRLAHALDQEAIKVWLDERELRIGDSLWDGMASGIDASAYLLILISPQSVASPWVLRELKAGLSNEMAERRKIVLPVVAEMTQFPVFLREKIFCDLSAGFEQGVAALVQAMA